MFYFYPTHFLFSTFFTFILCLQTFAGCLMFAPKTKDIVIRFDKTNNVLIFPEDGTQPTTKLAGLCSGTRNLDDKEIIYWYVDMFLDNIM